MQWFRTALGRLRRLTWGQLGRRTPSENAFLILLPVVGVVVGVASVTIAHLIAFGQKLAWGSGGDLTTAAWAVPWYWRVGILVGGGLIVGLIGVLFKVETRGAGTTGLIQAIALKSGAVSLRRTLPRTLAAIVTIATGGSLGREGPMITLGGALGSTLGRRFKLDQQHLRILVCAAAASAIAAVYNAPIGGSLFALEILMGNFALEVFGPVVVASVISTLIFRSAMGDLPRFVVPSYQLVSGWELPAYLVLGILGGIVSALFARSLFWAEDLFDKSRLPKWLAPAIGFGLVGGLAVWCPHVLGNGYETVNLALHEGLSWKFLLLLPLAKLVATALTLGSRGAGGLFMPTLMIGGLLGGAFGFGVHALFPAHTAGSGAYALVGMGAVVAGTTHAPLTAIMLIYEQTNSYLIVLPLMFTCIISNWTVRLLKTRSIHDETLRRRGVMLPRGPEAGVMQTLRVAEVMHSEVPAVSQSAPFAVVVERFLKETYNHLYVVDSAGKFLGAIRLHALKEMLHQSDALRSVIARDLVDETFPFVTPDQYLADTMDKFWQQNCERLPVVNSATERTLIGWMSERDLIGVYSQEILRKRQLLGHFVTTDGDERRSEFVELPEGFELRTFELPAALEGKTLAELTPRSSFGVHVLAIKSRNPVTGRDLVALPNPQAKFTVGDRLIVIGSFEGIAQFMAALATELPDAPGEWNRVNTPT